MELKWRHGQSDLKKTCILKLRGGTVADKHRAFLKWKDIVAFFYAQRRRTIEREELRIRERNPDRPWDMVMIFSLGKYDESRDVRQAFTCKNFISLMRGEPTTMFGAAIQAWFDDPDADASNLHKKILKTTRCYTSNQWGKVVPVTHQMLKIAAKNEALEGDDDDDDSGAGMRGRRSARRSPNLMEEYERNVLRKEYIDIVGVDEDGEPKETDEQTFNCLVCQTIVHRL